MAGIIKKIVFSLLLAAIPVTSFAANIYVAESGAGDGSACNNARTMAYANTNAVANDVVLLCNDGGTITTGINPAANGTSGNVITYKPAAGEVVVITPGSPYYAINLLPISADREYITVDGLNTGGSSLTFNISAQVSGSAINMSSPDTPSGYSANNNIIQNVTFEAAAVAVVLETYHAVEMRGDCDNNKILNNVFNGAEVDSTSGTFSDWFYVRSTNGSTIEKNVIEGNTINGGAHNAIMLTAFYGGTVQKNVIRDNTITVRYHSGINVWNGTESHNLNYTLIEGNNISGMGAYCSSDEYACPENYNGSSGDKLADRFNHPGIQFGSRYGIIRNNIVWVDVDVVADGAGTGIAQGADGAGEQNLEVKTYHNTFYNMDLGFYGYVASSSSQENGWLNNIFDTIAGHVGFAANPDHHYYKTESEAHWFTNNLFSTAESDIQYRDAGGTHSSQTPAQLNGASADWTGNIAGDPAFTNENDGDFTLTSSSTDAIDAAAPLTTTTNAATGTALTVADGYYFYDGWGISGETGDYIYIEDIGKVQVSAITGDAITLTAVATWTSGKNVYFCPDGVCFYGSAPDIGAFEYNGTPIPVITPALDPSNIDTATDSGTLSVTGTATDDNAVTDCKWRIGDPVDAGNGTGCTADAAPFASASEDFTCATTFTVEGANTLYVGCTDAEANWGNDSIVVNFDETAPTVTAKVIQASGTVFRVTFSEKVHKGASWANNEYNLDVTGGTGSPSADVSLTYTEIYGGGTGTNTWYFTIGETIAQNATVNFDLSATANVIEDHAKTTVGNDVAQITDGATDNQSAQGDPPTTPTGVGVSIN